MIDEVVDWIRNRTTDESVTVEARRLVQDFIAANPGANTRAIRAGVSLSHNAVDAILRDGEASGELIMTVGARKARCYTVSQSRPEVPLAVLVTAPESPRPCLETKILVPEATINCASPVPDLGTALLRPGPKATVPEPSVTVPEVTVPDRARPIEEPAPTPESAASPIVDDMRTDIPPRTPAEIAELLKVETDEQTQRRIANDKLRYALQHARGGPNAQTAMVYDKPSGKTLWVKR